MRWKSAGLAPIRARLSDSASRMSTAVNPNIAGLQPYKPGKPPEEVARELGITDVVKLASNENPRGPGARVREGIAAALGTLSRYPDGSGYRLRQALARHHDIEPNRITLGNGSNDVLDLATRMALEPGFEGIMSQYGFIVYYLATTGCGGRLVTVPARAYGCDTDAFADAIGERTRILFIANPNNPTGTWLREGELVGLLERVPERVWGVLDEAYLEYIETPGYPDGRTLLERYPNLIVTRTFSKIHGLASLRVGYALSSAYAADLMNRARQPFNVNSLALVAAEAALQDRAFVASSRAMNHAGMALLTSGLDDLGLAHIPSLGNFLCIDLGRDSRPVFQALLARGVIVRRVAEYGLPTHIRATIGLPAENRRLLDALREVL